MTYNLKKEINHENKLNLLGVHHKVYISKFKIERKYLLYLLPSTVIT